MTRGENATVDRKKRRFFGLRMKKLDWILRRRVSKFLFVY